MKFGAYRAEHHGGDARVSASTGPQSGQTGSLWPTARQRDHSGLPLDWPNRALSALRYAGGIEWHVQSGGAGPRVLLLHGTGAATHTWRNLLPNLTRNFEVLAPDLPGHGFTASASASQLSLPGMARALRALLDETGFAPDIIAGHSAGAAVGAQMIFDGLACVRSLVSLNGALLPLRGTAGAFFTPAARLLAATPAPRLIARAASVPGFVEQLVRSTGSRLDDRGVGLYKRLVSQPEHIAGALGMMARWDLEPLCRQLPGLRTDLVLVVGTRDTTVPPSDADRISQLVGAASIEKLAGLGHLAHEERPDLISELMHRVRWKWEEDAHDAG